jgi:hypothetical protein
MSNLSINDLMKRFFDSGAPASTGADGIGVATNDPRVINKYPSVSNAGTVTAPLAGASITAVSLTNAGFYKIRLTYGYGGTAESTAADNFEVTQSGTPIFAPLAAVGVANTLFPWQEFFINAAAGDVIRANAIAAASAGSVYKAMIVADRYL